ncbi:nitrate reductase molybdenum cofactor assembly chaperone [Actinotalea sp. K2]|uniref:nitrate reductase molybdenum cofactor assembly chaperone n=1 Tax=Actinotalea sp. K2 TaxID=2939438 RepID=UPI002016E7BC|nr:nitrate reductase molybdenum cofactor assembly chaperone [Actinotalea sp. K2]MCL3862767.1 nitrate reductase molybdenum cofactor assembly chaperone [Actinotalea sp. K2]
MNRAARAASARTAAQREHAVVHRVAALLLEYPSVELIDLLPQLRAASHELSPRLRDPLLEVVDHLGSRPLPELEAEYVATFDLKRRCALYLTYYAYGDTRKRGVALVTFKQAYRAAGFELAADELPDHLAVVLEFASTGGPETWVAGIRLLLEHRAGLELLRLALVDSGSAYAGALVAVTSTLPALQGEDREAVARLAAEGPPGEDVGLEPFAPPSYMPDPNGSDTHAPLQGARR